MSKNEDGSALDSPSVIAARGRDYAACIDGCATLVEVQALYADALGTYGPDGLDWKQVNGAILARWSESSLEKVKRLAWKAVRN